MGQGADAIVSRDRPCPPITRRAWLAGVLAALPSAGLFARVQRGAAGQIDTVTGPVAAASLGTTLMHEHVLVDFIGAAGVRRDRYDADVVFKRALPHLERVRQLGCETLVDCTPAYLGRDAQLLKRLSEASGLRIVTNTGLYGAANDKHLPAFAFTETADQLAARWTREAEEGIDGTSVRPGLMKIGVDQAPLSDVDATLVRAAALTARKTGLPIASHTGSGAAAMAELDLIEAGEVHPASFIWVHAQSEKNASFHVRAARRGAWVEFDGVSPSSVDRHVDLVVAMKSAGLLDRVLVSHDAGWYHVGEPDGGSFRPFDTVFTQFVPALKRAGFSDEEIRTLLVTNPARALARR
jgi:phosphotriesterase-related protein